MKSTSSTPLVNNSLTLTPLPPASYIRDIYISFPHLDADLTKLDRRFDVLEAKVEHLEDRFDGLDERIRARFGAFND